MFSRAGTVPVWVAVVILLTVAGCGSPSGPSGTDISGETKQFSGKMQDPAAMRDRTAITCRSLEAPLEVAGMRLTSVTSGEEASSRIAIFLGSDFTVNEIYTTCYSGVSCEIVFWIVELEGMGHAEALLAQMKQHVQSSPCFEGYHSLADRTVDELHYACYTGSDTVFVHHYFYRKSSRVYWVSMSGARQVSMLRQFLPLF